MSNLKDKTIEELRKDMTDKREALRKFRFDMTGSKIKNVKEFTIIKKDIARIMTEINKRK